ncbi:MAG TPA: MFS transporter [Chthoniobacterales bacterium]|jgi:MFS family permease|nr:MFS transporter [Chthoniobacterales bacterium]
MEAPNQPEISRGKRFADFFALKRNLVIILVAIFVIGAGEELWMRFVPKYLQTLGASAFVIGLYDALRTLISAIYAYPGGFLADRWGHRRAFITFNLVSIAGYALVLLIPHWGAVIAGMFLFLSWTCFSLPATFSLVGASVAANRYSMGIGVQMVIKRLPIMIAPLVGGILIDRFGVIPGVRVALIISILLAGATFIALRELREEVKESEETVAMPERWNFLRCLREFDAPMRWLLLSDILVRFCERIPFAWVVIFAMDYAGASGEQVGLLTTIEVLVATLCIIPSSHFADKQQREPFVVTTFVMFTLFPIVLLFSRSFHALMIAFFIRGLKEFGDTSRKALIVSYSEPERRGQMIGAYYLIRDSIVSVGAILGAYLWNRSPAANFLGAAAFGIAGTILYLRATRHERRRARENIKIDISRLRLK